MDLNKSLLLSEEDAGYSIYHCFVFLFLGEEKSIPEKRKKSWTWTNWEIMELVRRRKRRREGRRNRKRLVEADDEGEEVKE